LEQGFGEQGFWEQGAKTEGEDLKSWDYFIVSS